MENTRVADVENPTQIIRGVTPSFTTSFFRDVEKGQYEVKRSKLGLLLTNIQLRNKMFLISCVIAVSFDPLFFYIPIIDEDNKCLGKDKNLRIAALLSRSLTDIIFLVHFVYEVYEAIKTRSSTFTVVRRTTWYEYEVCAKSKRQKLIEFAKGIRQKMSWLSLSIAIDFLALLPIPQLLIVVVFYEMGGSGYLEHRKVLNLFLLGQYLPRIYRIHLWCKELTRATSRIWTTTKIWAKGLLNLLLYILVSHVFGAFWYFFSIQRETSCWRQACVKYSANPKECMSSFYCDGQKTSSTTITILNERCPLNTPDGTEAPFDFGIFLDSLKNHNSEHVNFARKLFYSFWWGLRNLSNFGTNLTTSTYVWENFFAILISIIGLVLFLYLFGNVEASMRLEAKKSDDKTQKIRMKELDVRSWISRNELPYDLRKEIMNIIKLKLDENKDADLVNLFSILPVHTRKSLKRCLCMKTLMTIPMLKNLDEKVLRMMCDYLKPVVYNENSFIFRMGDPLDCMLFIVEGTMWTYCSPSTSNTDTTSEAAAATSPSSVLMATKALRKGDFYGEELLIWASPTFTTLPISTRHVRCQRKVEAFALMADDLATVLSKCQLHWNFSKCNNPQEVKEVAASTILRRFRHIQALMSSSSPRLRSSEGGGATTTTAVATPTGENSPLQAINYYLKKR